MNPAAPAGALEHPSRGRGKFLAGDDIVTITVDLVRILFHESAHRSLRSQPVTFEACDAPIAVGVVGSARGFCLREHLRFFDTPIAVTDPVPRHERPAMGVRSPDGGPAPLDSSRFPSPRAPRPPLPPRLPRSSRIARSPPGLSSAIALKVGFGSDGIGAPTAECQFSSFVRIAWARSGRLRARSLCSPGSVERS